MRGGGAEASERRTRERLGPTDLLLFTPMATESSACLAAPRPQRWEHKDGLIERDGKQDTEPPRQRRKARIYSTQGFGFGRRRQTFYSPAQRASQGARLVFSPTAQHHDMTVMRTSVCWPLHPRPHRPLPVLTLQPAGVRCPPKTRSSLPRVERFPRRSPKCKLQTRDVRRRCILQRPSVEPGAATCSPYPRTI